jgi:branched-chain amino acid transport system substrate-binding protein
MLPAPEPGPQPLHGERLPPPPKPAGPAKVALLVPLTGSNAALGKALLDAAQMALFDNPDTKLALIPRDTGGTPAGAAAAAHAAIADGAQLILGPLLATEVEAVKPVAQDKHLNVIAFSTVTQLAGGNVFLMGFLPKPEVVREVGFAQQRGIGRFAALAPNSAYGHVMTDALRAVTGADGTKVSDVEFYDPAGGDAADPIRRLLSGGAAAAAGGAPAAGPPFDALLLPEGGARLRAIARALVAAGLDVKAVRLLGSGLWDEPDIGNEPALQGGWFAAPAPAGREAFEQRFSGVYGHAPPRLASLGYDAAALAAALAKGEAGGTLFSHQAITNPSGFTGVDGLFRFRDDGLVQRGLAVFEVDPQGAEVISPAPHSFAEPGL